MLAVDRSIAILAIGTVIGTACDRLVQLPRLDPSMGKELAAALAHTYRTQRELADARRELEISHRAGRVVSSEFRRQNLRLEEQEKQQRLQNQRFDAALNNMSQGLCMFEADGRLVVSNRRYIEMYRLSPAIVRAGCSLRDLLMHRKETGSLSADIDEYCDTLQQSIAQGAATDQIVTIPDGRTIAIINQPMEGGGWVATHEDITERTLAEAKIKYMARHDALTELPNRVAFHESMAQALVRTRRKTKQAVLCLDLDEFKNVNDTLGHPVGDTLLRAVSTRLRTCVRDADTVARLGGDEFAILQTDIGRPEDAGALAQRIINVLNDPFDVDGLQVVIGASIGIAMAPHDGRSAEDLMRNADMALYRAKAEGRSTYRFFE